MPIIQDRRRFLAGLSAVGTAGLIGARTTLAAEESLETTTLRLRRDPSICVAPWYVAEDLLRAEGFTDVRWVTATAGTQTAEMITRGEIDYAVYFAAALVYRLDAGVPLTALAGVHVGCFQLFAHDPVRTIRDLKGRKVGVDAVGGAKYMYVAILAASVGLDPHNDIEWVTDPLDPMALFVERKVDAFLAFPPEPQELRARNIGRLIVDTTTDKPWSQYFCCVLVGNRDFVRRHPIASKRLTRAILKANEICGAEPERVARLLVERGFTEQYDYALETLAEIPYGAWREFDAEDSMRFFALRLHQVGLIQSSPNQLLADGTDWRFVNELKLALKS